MALIIGPYNNLRDRPGEHCVDMNELIQVLQSRRISIQKDDSLMPGNDFIPCLYPGMALFSCLHSLFSNLVTDDLTKK